MTDDTEPNTEISTIRRSTKVSSLEGVFVNSVLTWPQLADVARGMAGAGIALPPHCRGEPELCFAICSKAVAWKVEDPFFLAENSYVVEQSMRTGNGGWEKVRRLAYNSAVFQYAIIRSGALIGRPQYSWDGEGIDRTCTVQVLDRETNVWQSLTSQPLGKLHPGHTDKSYVKGSPLWDTDPDQQLGYHTLRRLVRLMYQDVLGGFYDRHEFEEQQALSPPPSDSFLERLKQKNRTEPAPEEINPAPTAAEVADTQQPKRRRKARNPETYKEGWEKRRANAAIKEALAETTEEEGIAAQFEAEYGQPDSKLGSYTVKGAAAEAQDEPPEEKGPTPFEPEPAPTPATAPARRQPTTQAEYIDYAERMIRGYGADQLHRWYASPSEKARQQACKVSKLAYDMLLVKINEKLAQAKATS